MAVDAKLLAPVSLFWSIFPPFLNSGWWGNWVRPKINVTEYVMWSLKYYIRRGNLSVSLPPKLYIFYLRVFRLDFIFIANLKKAKKFWFSLSTHQLLQKWDICIAFFQYLQSLFTHPCHLSPRGLRALYKYLFPYPTPCPVT